MTTPSSRHGTARQRRASDVGCPYGHASYPVPGHHDGWSPVQFFTRLVRPFSRLRPERGAHPTVPEDPTQQQTADAPARASRGRRLVLPAAVAAVALVVGGGTAAYAAAHKTVTLDVDGQLRQVSTFAGSVEGLLHDEGVVLGARDDVQPHGRLTDGATITVRSAHQIRISQDGEQRTVWTTALTADEALDLLAARDPDVQLVASRSASGGRPQLTLDLSVDGKVTILVDDERIVVEDARTTVAEALDQAGVELTDLDQVSLRNDVHGHPVVVVTRVVVKDETYWSKVKFSTTTREDPDRYEGDEVVLTKGVMGTRAIVERVTYVDGVETSRVRLSDEQTKKPVTQVVAVGTKERPVAKSNPGPIGDTRDADSLNWAALAQCESGGNPTIVSANGLYHGLYQFSVGTWASVGGSGLPSQAPAAEQTARAKMLYLRSGAGQWPHCGPRLFS